MSSAFDPVAALTYALREALFALTDIEGEVLLGSGAASSDFKNVLEVAMLRDEEYWARYCNGSEMEKKLKRKYSGVSLSSDDALKKIYHDNALRLSG